MAVRAVPGDAGAAAAPGAPRGCSGAGPPRGGAARPPNGADGAAGRAQSAFGGAGNAARREAGVACRVRARLLDRGSHTWLRHPSAAGSCRPQSGAAGGSWARPRRCPAGPGSEAVPLGSHERAVFCRQDANTPSSAVGSPSPGHSAPGEAFLQPGTAWRVSESLASSWLWLKDGPLQSILAPWPPQGRGLTQKDVLTAEFPPQNLLIKGSERLSKSMLRRT